MMKKSGFCALMLATLGWTTGLGAATHSPDSSFMTAEVSASALEQNAASSLVASLPAPWLDTPNFPVFPVGLNEAPLFAAPLVVPSGPIPDASFLEVARLWQPPAPPLPAPDASFLAAMTQWDRAIEARSGSEPDMAEEASILETAHTLIEEGLEYLGIRYRYGSNNPSLGLDCSGFVQNVFRSALAFDLPRSARDMAKLGEKVGKADLQPGDLVFFNTMRRTFSHVGIYLGEGRFLHSASSGGGVRIDEMGASYWSKRYTGARRLLDESLLSLMK
jgi:cell wall-associated NlpC family hydrolase